jgi:hypothetical protein
MTAENTAGKQRGRPFTKGRSGNPSGKPRGARHRATLAAEALLDGEAEALTRKAIELALAGDPIALRLCLDRILPPRRERPFRFVLPELRSAADAGSAMAAILAAVASGDTKARIASSRRSVSGVCGAVIECAQAALAASDTNFARNGRRRTGFLAIWDSRFGRIVRWGGGSSALGRQRLSRPQPRPEVPCVDQRPGTPRHRPDPSRVG